MEAIEFKYRGQGYYTVDEQHWGDSYGWFYPKAEADAEIARLEAEVERLKKSQKITVNPPAMPESEVIKYLQDTITELRKDIFRYQQALEGR